MNTSSNDYKNIKQLIDSATNDMFFQPDLGLNFNIVDLVNNNSSNSEMVAYALKSRLLESSEDMVIILCMDLYEALMKNCETLIPYFGRRDFQEPLVKLSVESKSFRVRDKILDIIQFLADGFKERDDLFFYQAYRVLLLHHKVSFPPKREEVYAQPKKQVNVTTTSSQPSFNPYSFDTQNLHKSSKIHDTFMNDPFGIGHDIGTTVSSYESVPFNTRSQPQRTTTSTVRMNKADEAIYKQVIAAKESCLLLLDLLDNTPQGRELKDNEVVNEVLNECRSLRKSFLKLIEECSLLHNEKLLDDVLKLNDQLGDVITEYSKALKGERVVRKPSQKKKSPKSKDGKKKKGKKSKKNDEVDEFALLASRKRPESHEKNSTITNNLFLSNNNMFQDPLPQKNPPSNQFDFLSTGSTTQSNPTFTNPQFQPQPTHTQPQPFQQQPSLFNDLLQPQQTNMNPTPHNSSFNDPSFNLFNINQQPSSPLQTQQPPTNTSLDKNMASYNPFAQDISPFDQNVNNQTSIDQLSSNNNNQSLFGELRSPNDFSPPTKVNNHQKKVSNPFENMM